MSTPHPPGNPTGPTYPQFGYSDFFQTLENTNSVVPPQDITLPTLKNGVAIPQGVYYRKGVGRESLIRGVAVFFRQDGSYLPVIAALEEDFDGLILRDVPTLSGTGHTVTLRFEWPGYPSKEFQLRTLDWSANPNKITLSKLATEVSKLVRKFVEKTQEHPIAPKYAQWKVGPGGIEVKDLRLAALEQVNAGCWQVRLFYKPAP